MRKDRYRVKEKKNEINIEKRYKIMYSQQGFTEKKIQKKK